MKNVTTSNLKLIDQNYYKSHYQTINSNGHEI